MAGITWDEVGLRVYQTGVDRGMLYTTEFGVLSVAVPWSGLASVTEAPVGGDPSPYYLDGRKILNIAAGVDFAGTIQAYSAPLEFAPCAGHTQMSTGLYAADQPKQTFGFSYRTMIGNDLVGTSFGYKLHLVYNATAKVSDYTHATVSKSPSPNVVSWDITTVPLPVAGYRPTSHFIFDTRYVASNIISHIEDILYGNDTDDPRMPTQDELFTYLTTPGTTWWDLTGLSDFPTQALPGDMGVDFSSDNLYADVISNDNAYWWDLTGGADFPNDALVGDWGLDTVTGDVYKKTG